MAGQYGMSRPQPRTNRNRPPSRGRGAEVAAGPASPGPAAPPSEEDPLEALGLDAPPETRSPERAAAPWSGGQLPSLAQQKRFIVDNVAVLNKETKIAILSIVMMEIGPAAGPEGEPTKLVVYESGSREVDIDLDAVGELNQEVLAHIYNIVHARREVLSQPARQ